MGTKFYPKILIIGQSFDLQTGAGITMSNLFYGWDKNKIAVATEIISNPNFEVCEKYYQFGSLEIERRFPFSLNPLQRQRKSLRINGKGISDSSGVLIHYKKSTIRNVFEIVLDLTGLVHHRRKLKISNDFLQWVKDFSPDVIYSQLASLDLIRLVHDLRQELQLPLAIHMMDDWPRRICNGYFAKMFWQRTINKEFLDLISDAEILLSISDAMSQEYLKRYNLKFTAFHNPINLKGDSLIYKKNYELNGPFRILYAGRIGIGIKNSLLEIAEGIKSLTKQGFKIELHLQPINYSPFLKKLGKFEFIRQEEMVSYGELISIFTKYDLLVLPNDFDKKSKIFLRYSMPTKASEYMISGTPILLYSSYENAITRHAMKNNWASIVPERNKCKLMVALSELYEKIDKRILLGTTARKFALEHFDAEKIREQFRNSFILD